jgi:hypothetical protein
MIRKLSKKELALAVKENTTCDAVGCDRPATHIDQMGSGEDDESQLYCAVCAAWAENVDREMDSAYQSGLKDGGTGLPKCITDARSELMKKRQQRAEIIRTAALVPQLRAAYMEVVAAFMDYGMSEQEARYKVVRHLDVPHKIAVELSLIHTGSGGEKGPGRIDK